MIWIIGGTSETSLLLKLLSRRTTVVISVATESGTSFIDHDDMVVGRMDGDAMVSFIRSRNIRAVADLSHPYATEVSRNARDACQTTSVPYARYIREPSEIGDVVSLPSLAQCLRFLKGVEGTVFFTTGSKYIPDFEMIKGTNRFVYRVLPAVESMEICREHQLAFRDIIAALGPFSLEMNLAMFKEVEADYVVMKNSGDRGGTLEKVKACHQLGITPVILEREEETGFQNLQKLADYLNQFQNSPTEE